MQKLLAFLKLESVPLQVRQIVELMQVLQIVGQVCFLEISFSFNFNFTLIFDIFINLHI